MKKLVFLSSCSKEELKLLYNITNTVTSSNGVTINKVKYGDNQGDLIELTNVTSPWTINLHVKARLGLEATAYGDISY